MSKAIMFSELILKFNPHHDGSGRFSTADGSVFMTTRTRDPGKQHLADKAQEREKARATRKEISTVENRIRNDSTETAAVVKDGVKIIDKSDGKTSEVSFTFQECASMNGAVLTHNHPGGRTFSQEDIGMTTAYNLKEMRAVHKSGVYTLTQVGGGNKKSSDFSKDYENNYKNEKKKTDKVFKQKQADYNANKISLEDFKKAADELNKTLNDSRNDWLEKNSKNYGYEYNNS